MSRSQRWTNTLFHTLLAIDASALIYFLDQNAWFHAAGCLAAALMIGACWLRIIHRHEARTRIALARRHRRDAALRRAREADISDTAFIAFMRSGADEDLERLATRDDLDRAGITDDQKD